MRTDGTCDPTPIADCSAKHGGDPFEPDECPESASVLELDQVSRGHRIFPEGDEDWFTFAAVPGHVMELRLQDSSYPIRVDLFGPDGATRLASGWLADGERPARLFGTSRGPFLARVKAERADSYGEYELVLHDLGEDDLGSAPELVLQPADGFRAAIQFEGDVDVASVAVTPHHAYRLTATAATTGIEVRARDHDTILGTLTAPRESITVLALSDSMILSASSAHGTELGDAVVAIEDLGEDDRSDSTTAAEVVTAGESIADGMFERAGDVDAVRFNVEPGRIYAVSCTSSDSNASCETRLRDSAGAPVDARTDVAAARAIHAGLWSATFSLSSSGLANYSVKLEDRGPDDHGDSRSFATLLTVGVPVPGALQFERDRDYFSFQAQAGHIYRVHRDLTAAPPSTCVTYLESSMGDALGASGAFDPAIKATSSDAYFVRVQGSNLEPVSYSLVVTDEGLDDHGDDSASADPISVGATVTGKTQFIGDPDVYMFTPQPNHVYRATCIAPGCVVRAFNPLSFGDEGHGSVSWLAPDSAPNYVSVTAQTYASYTLELVDDGLDDHGSDSSTAQTVTVDGALASGKIQFPQDLDAFSFAGVKDTVYAVTVGSTSIVSALINEASGTVLGYANTLDQPTLLVKAISTEPIVVNVTGNDAPVDYTVRVETAPPDDYGDSASSATTLTLPASLSGEISFFGDTDAFSFSASGGHVYAVHCQTTSIPCWLTTSSYGGVTLEDAAMHDVFTGFTMRATGGTVSVRVGSEWNATGSYTLSVTDFGPDDFDSDNQGPTPISLGAPINGAIQGVVDRDVFVFNATPGQSYTATTGNSAVKIEILGPINDSVIASGMGTVIWTGTNTAPTSNNPNHVRLSSASSQSYTLTVQ